MSESKPKDRSVASEAAEWFLHMQECPPSKRNREGLLDWLLESPVNVREYLEVAKLYSDLETIDPGRKLTVEDASEANVVKLPAAAQPIPGDEARTRRERWKGRLAQYRVAASVVLTCLLATAYYAISGGGTTTYRTALGEQRSIVLEDGSVVSMNTLSEVETNFTGAARRVRLLSGEVLFDVERDVRRPFIVETQAAVVTVTGTTFNVRSDAANTAVTVLHGSVNVARRHEEDAVEPAAASADLFVGEQLVVSVDRPQIDRTVLTRPEAVTAWTQRKLVFDDEPLASIVEQFNRYNRKRFVIEDPELSRLALSGVFNCNDLDSFALFLEQLEGIEVTEATDGSRHIARRQHTL